MSGFKVLDRFRSPVGVNWTMAAVVFLAGCWVAVEKLDTFRANGVQPQFYQNEFEPAVMLACGRGWVVTDHRQRPPALSAFLALEHDEFDCSSLPANLRVVPAEGNPLSMAGGMPSVYYLFHTTAAWWRLFGLRWTALDGLIALLVGVSAVALYGLLRTAASPWIAAGVALLLIASPKFSVEMLSLRTYSKGTFMLVALFVLAQLVGRPMSLRAMLALAGACGLIIGFGYGFRSDLLVVLPLALVITQFLLPGHVVKNAARNGLVSLALLAGFVAMLWPAWVGAGTGGCQFHVALLGLTAPRVADMGLSSFLYNFGSPYLDTFASLKVDEYAAHTLRVASPVLCSTEYDEASARLFWDITTTFPADAVARAYGSGLTVLSRGFEVASAGNVREFALLNRVTAWLVPAGPVLAGLAVAVVWARSTRLGIATALALVYLAVYPAILFEERHWFHLRFLSWWALLVVAGAAVGAAPIKRQDFFRGAVAVSGLVGALAVLLGSVRTVQARSVRDLLSAYEAAPVQDVVMGAAVENFLPVELSQRADAGDTSRPAARHDSFLSLTIDPALCLGVSPALIRARYDADRPEHDLSSNIVIAAPSPAGAPTRVFVPVFADGIEGVPHLRFSGFEIIGAPSSCISRVQEVVGDAQSLLRIKAQLPTDWRTRPLYQRINYPTVR